MKELPISSNCLVSNTTGKKLHVHSASMAVLENSVQNERYVSGIFDNEEKICEE